MADATPNVLIAEDNPGLARVLSYKFRLAGLTPLVCADGQSAWETFQTKSVAAVVSDQQMPRMCGIELCHNIRKTDPAVPLFLITGHQLELNSADTHRDLKLERVFGKPFSPTAVITAVRQAVEHTKPTRHTELSATAD